MPALRHEPEHWGDKPRYWQQHAERARKRAQELQQRAEHAPRYLTKQRILKLAKRYEQMANLAEARINNPTAEFMQ
jgi:hypothetical protein